MNHLTAAKANATSDSYGFNQEHVTPHGINTFELKSSFNIFGGRIRFIESLSPFFFSDLDAHLAKHLITIYTKKSVEITKIHILLGSQ